MEVTIPYLPRAPFVEFHRRGKRWAVLVVHRRGGKTVAAINELIKGALTCRKPNPRFAYIAPFRKQAKLVAWDYLKHFSQAIPGIKISESDLTVRYPNGAMVSLFGADNYDALRGIYLDGVCVDEPADMDEAVWKDILRPALSDRQGWCVWIGTPKGRNAFFRLYDRACSDPEYYTMVLKASVSNILPADELESARRAMGKESFEREYECSFDASIPGSIYGDVMAQLRGAGRIKDFVPSASCPYFTSWDVGDSDYCVPNLLQLEGRDINLVDYYSGSGHGPGHYANKCREWEAKYQMTIDCHYLPHDAANIVRGGSWQTDLTAAGLRNIKIVHVTPDKWRGIHHLHDELLPRFYIHKTNCSKVHGSDEERSAPTIIDCLDFYAKEEVQENDGLKEKPIHNEFSHGADSLRTFAEAHRMGMLDGVSKVARETRNRPVTVLRGAGPQSYPVGGRTMFKQRPRVIR